MVSVTRLSKRATNECHGLSGLVEDCASESSVEKNDSRDSKLEEFA